MSKSKLYDISDTEFKNIVANSTTMSECVVNVTKILKSSVHVDTVKRRVKQLDLSTEHFLTMTQRATLFHTLDIEDVFVENSTVSNTTVRNKVIENDLIPYNCALCGCSSEWNGHPLTLQLDHINGNNKDNRLVNLRFLCPNCHSQTKTWGSKNVKFSAKVKKSDKACSICGNILGKGNSSGRCLPCANKINGALRVQATVRPPKEILTKLLKESNFQAVAKAYKVSDTTVRKWCKYYSMSTNIKDYK